MQFVVLLLLVFVVECSSINYTLTVDSNSIIRSIPIRFYGFQLDWWKTEKWGNAGILSINLSNTNLINLVSSISPAWLRIGGSPQDSIVYNISGACDNNASLPGYGCSDQANNYGCLSITRWQEINHFAAQTNVSLLFGLNACYGRPSKSKAMNFSNIRQLLDVTLNSLPSNDITNLFAFEFGEEEEGRINADTYAQDFYTLYEIVNEYWNKYNKGKNIPRLMGFDVPMSGESLPWSRQIISNLSVLTNNNVSSVLDKVAYHHYPNCKFNASADSVYPLKCLNSINSYAYNYKTLADTINITAMMGEGSEHNGGGIKNVTNTFVSSFYYLYQLCQLLEDDVPSTIRSDLVGGYYELINKTTFLPNPDYWILYLWKQFIAHKMYKIHSNIANTSKFRGYAFSTVNNINGFVVVLINFDMKNKAIIQINVNNKNNYKYNEYHLKPYGIGGLQTDRITVNHLVMEYKNGVFPTLKPINGNGLVTMDSATIAFILLTPS